MLNKNIISLLKVEIILNKNINSILTGRILLQPKYLFNFNKLCVSKKHIFKSVKLVFAINLHCDFYLQLPIQWCWWANLCLMSKSNW